LQIAAAHEARPDEAWARLLISRARVASVPADVDEARVELESALRLARECEARPLEALCQSALDTLA
jgi:hypothetical protein